DLDRAEDGSFVVSAELLGPSISQVIYGALVRFTSDGAGSVQAEVLQQSGSPIPVTPDVPSFFAQFQESLGYNSSGGLMSMPLLANALETIFVNGVKVAQEGGTTPVFGMLWETFFRKAVALGEGGDYAFVGNSGTSDKLVWNGALVARTGESLPDIAPFQLSAFGPASSNVTLDVADDGGLFWIGSWLDPNRGFMTGLFRDQDLIIRSGEATVEGAGVIGVGWLPAAGSLPGNSPNAPFDIDGGGIRVVYRADLDDGRQVAAREVLKGQVTLIAGCQPKLATLIYGGGPAIGSSPTLGMLTAQDPGAVAVVAVSLAASLPGSPCGVNLPGVGELLVNTGPESLLTFLSLPLTPQVPVAIGSLDVPDNAALIGLDVYYQGAWIDVGGSTPEEPYRLTNAVRVSYFQ
ncbi:MAG: hypothetical protein AAFZ65_09985, partial [Planctomycetota bacterium]